jgi:acetyl esterase/lipase
MPELHLPTDRPGPHPYIVAIHGGGFVFGDKRADKVNAPLEACVEAMRLPR